MTTGFQKRQNSKLKHLQVFDYIKIATVPLNNNNKNTRQIVRPRVSMGGGHPKTWIIEQFTK